MRRGSTILIHDLSDITFAVDSVKKLDLLLRLEFMP
jgi:hypothetical protein